jgi:hypothetical protein
MASRIEALLSAAEADQQPLSFAVFVPGWTDEPAWAAMKVHGSRLTVYGGLWFPVYGVRFAVYGLRSRIVAVIQMRRHAPIFRPERCVLCVPVRDVTEGAISNDWPNAATLNLCGSGVLP